HSCPPTGSQIPAPPDSPPPPSSGPSSPYQPPRSRETTPAAHSSTPASSLPRCARSSSVKRAQESLAAAQRVPKSACPCCPLLTLRLGARHFPAIDMPPRAPAPTWP